MTQLHESRNTLKSLPSPRDADVVVAGGGLGGIAAALAAARSGARTLLIERNTYVGGVATAGMCCSIFNCFFTSRHQPGSCGIPMEIADRLAAAMGYGTKWREHKGHVIYDLEQGKLTLQELLEEAGVELLLGATVTDAVKESERLVGLAIAGKKGREIICGKRFVDATGDADLAVLAGAPVHMPEQLKTRIQSLCFRLGNVNVDEFITYFRNHPEEYPAMMDVEWTLDEALRQYEECGTFLFPHGGGMQMKAFRQAKEDGLLPSQIGLHDTTDACQMHGMRQTGMVHVVTGYVKIDGLDAGEISRAICDGRRMAFQLAEVYRRYLPGFERTIVAGVADNLGVRASRWIAGDFVLDDTMTAAGSRYVDAVARMVPYRNVVRHPGSKAWGVQEMGEDTFDLPYRCLLPQLVDNLIMGAGRSISIVDPFQLRVMVHTMSVGQAAGAAAAVSANCRTTFRQTEVKAIQQALGKLGEKI